MNILDRIIADTHDVVAARKREFPLSRLQDDPHYRRPVASLAASLRTDGVAVIAELKRRSPSKGVLREAFEVEEIAEGYVEGGAAALSVLTEPLYFDGQPEYLRRVREVVDVPLLRKDFVVDRYQLHEARAIGADAVLLIASVLDGSQLEDLHAEAAEIGLECLVEIHDREELQSARFDGLSILGVNNRDLRTFEVDLDHCLRVFEDAPAGVICVAESGIRTADDLVRLASGGVDAVLIGEAFMRAPHPGDALRRLLDAFAEALDAR
jgi:indole-3-glycerol phosphate synthase